MFDNSALVIFVKNPVLGKVKTRLAADVGDEAALTVYKNLLHRTREIVHPVNVSKFVFYSDFIEEDDIWPNDHYEKFLQDGENIGEKMLNAIKLIFDQWYEAVVIVGSDCYDLTTGIIESSFMALQKDDCVIGPATDGGYYLIGMKEELDVFDGIKWSSDEVKDKTLDKLEAAKKQYTILEPLSDVDTLEDLKNYKELLKKETIK